MKKFLICLLAVLLVIVSLISCDMEKEKVPDDPNWVFDDISKISGITREDHENYTVFKFNNFKGKATLKMDRIGLQKDHLYYKVNIDKGTVNVRYDRGIYDSTESLGTFYHNVKLPESNMRVCGLDVDAISVIFEADEYVSGEIVISFIPFDND